MGGVLKHPSRKVFMGGLTPFKARKWALDNICFPDIN